MTINSNGVNVTILQPDIGNVITDIETETLRSYFVCLAVGDKVENYKEIPADTPVPTPSNIETSEELTKRVDDIETQVQNKISSNELENGNGTLIAVTDTQAQNGNFSYNRFGNTVVISLNCVVGVSPENSSYSEFSGIPYPIKLSQTKTTIVTSELQMNYSCYIQNNKVYIKLLNNDLNVLNTNTDTIYATLVYDMLKGEI